MKGLLHQLGDALVEGAAGQGARGDDAGGVGDVRDLAGDVGEVGEVKEPLRHKLGEPFPVHGKGAAGGDPGQIGASEDQRIELPKLLLQEAHGVFETVGPEGVGADQLREGVPMMGGGLFLRLHLPQGDGVAPAAQLIRSLRPGQARAHYGDVCHDLILSMDLLKAARFS